MSRQVVLDFETASACDLEVAGSYRYAEDPTTEIICLRWNVDHGEIKLWTPERGRDPELVELAEDPDALFIAHGAGFEKPIWRQLMVGVYGYPNIPNSRWHDTMAVCAMRSIPLDLDGSARALKLPVQKDMEGSRITRGLSKPNKRGYYDRSPATLERVYTYCAQDVAAEDAMLQRIGYLPASERNVWLLDQRINERGLLLDMPFVHAAQVIVDTASVPLLKEFDKLTGGLSPTQVQAYGKWLRDKGVELPDLRKETVATFLGTHEEEDHDSMAPERWESDPGSAAEYAAPEVLRTLQIRQLIGSSSVKKLRRMDKVVCADGRARGIVQYHGAGPGRWVGRLFQPHNFPRDAVLIDNAPADPQLVVDAIMTRDYQYVEAVLGPAVDTVVKALRHTIIPAPKRKLVVGDFAGIEARIVLALAGQHDKTALMASGADVYVDMACDIYNMPKFDVSDKALVKAFKNAHTPERTIGKNTILGCGFQMGGRKFRARYCPHQPQEFADGVVRAYRTKWAPKVPPLWKALEHAALETVLTGRPHEAYGVTYRMEGEWLTAELPSGRKLWYFHPEACRKTMPWSTPDQPDIRMAWCYYARKHGRLLRVDAYGGLLTENVVQALARDLLVAAMFKCERNGLPVVLTVHDEIVGEPLTGDADADTLDQIMTDRPAWAKAIQVPVQAECWEGDRYRK